MNGDIKLTEDNWKHKSLRAKMSMDKPREGVPFIDSADGKIELKRLNSGSRHCNNTVIDDGTLSPFERKVLGLDKND